MELTVGAKLMYVKAVLKILAEKAAYDSLYKAELKFLFQEFQSTLRVVNSGQRQRMRTGNVHFYHFSEIGKQNQIF